MKILYNNDRSKTYAVSYVPKLEGQHTVSVYFAGKEIPKSPYTVMVEGIAGDASKVTAFGPGLQPEGIVVNKTTYFDVVTKGKHKKKTKNKIKPQTKKSRLLSLRNTDKLMNVRIFFFPNLRNEKFIYLRKKKKKRFITIYFRCSLF